MSVQPTGSSQPDGEQVTLTLQRTLRFTPTQVWAALTDPAQLSPWIGTWTGDPMQGFVTFFMTAEGDDVTGTRYEIKRCLAEQALRVTASTDFGEWDILITLGAAGEGTALTFTQFAVAASAAGEIGPGWEYYLSRLTAHLQGSDPTTIAWDFYYPVLREYYATSSPSNNKSESTREVES